MAEGFSNLRNDTPSRPRLLLGDDHNILLKAVRNLLESEYDVVGTAANGRELVEAAAVHQPDLVVLDVGMPLLNGIDAAREIRQRSPDTKIVFLTQESGRAHVQEAIRAGASGYLLKQNASVELLDALRQVLAGSRFVSQSIGDAGALTAPKLTQRQHEVLRYLAEGRTAREIAATLGISIKTVEFHTKVLLDELGVDTVAELARYIAANHTEFGRDSID